MEIALDVFGIAMTWFAFYGVVAFTEDIYTGIKKRRMARRFNHEEENENKN